LVVFLAVFFVAFLVVFLALAADLVVARPAGFLLLGFLPVDLRPADWPAAAFERFARVVASFAAFDFLALAFVALATVAVRRAFATRFRDGGATARGTSAAARSPALEVGSSAFNAWLAASVAVLAISFTASVNFSRIDLSLSMSAPSAT